MSKNNEKLLKNLELRNITYLLIKFSTRLRKTVLVYERSET
jgi:hypothetical protein